MYNVIRNVRTLKRFVPYILNSSWGCPLKWIAKIITTVEMKFGILNHP